MNKYALIGSAMMLAMSTGAFAVSGEKLAKAECDALWMKANPTGGKLSEAAAAEYLTDVKAANPDGDTTIEHGEFRNACSKGMIKSSAASGASSGASGSDAGGASSK